MPISHVANVSDSLGYNGGTSNIVVKDLFITGRFIRPASARWCPRNCGCTVHFRRMLFLIIIISHYGHFAAGTPTGA